MKKKFILMVCFTVVSFCTFNIRSYAAENEEDISLADSVRIRERARSNESSFDLTKKLSVTEDKVFNLIKAYLKDDKLQKNDQLYLDTLNTLSSTDNLKLGRTEKEQAEFVEFATIYSARITPLISNNMNEEYTLNIEKERESLLNKTYQDIKQENIESILNSDTTGKPKPRGLSSGSFSIAAASNYAKNYAIKANSKWPNFGGLSGGGDCTNFTSQITNAAGKRMSYYPNNSGLYWYCTNRFAYGTAWTLAHQFVTYWSADYNVTYSCANKSQVNSKAIEGDFIAYMSKGTYQINHMSYVNAKRSGKVYVSQHSTNKYNVSLDSQNTSSYSSFIVLRIR